MHSEVKNGYTAHSDTFVRDRLPAQKDWPKFTFDLPELRYPEKINCATELLDNAIAEGFGNKLAIISSTERWTYAQLLDKVDRIAHVLRDDLKLSTGNRVLLRGANSPILYACWLAVVKAGGIVVATMPLLRSKELTQVIDIGKISLALCDTDLLDELQIAANPPSPLKQTISFNNGKLEQMMLEKSGHFGSVDTAQDDVAILAFTSGTTGKPKATIHFHRDVLAMADTFSKHILKPETSEIFCGTPPIAFTFGLGASLVFPLRARATVVTLENPGTDQLISALVNEKVTMLFTAPTAYRALLSEFDQPQLFLRQCVSAGEALPKATFEQWFDTTGIRIIDGMGTTEMIHIFISAAGEQIRPGAIGKAVPGYSARVIDNNNKPLPPGHSGRLAVIGPTGCRYLDDERQQEYVINGWNVTGDIFKLDSDGYFWYQGRSDDMIISSGYNIASIEVESAVLEHASVLECAVIGIPDENRGNIIKAFIILNSSFEPSDELIKDIQNHTKKTIAPYKYPRRIEFVANLPKTPTGKLQRFKLR